MLGLRNQRRLKTNTIERMDLSARWDLWPGYALNVWCSRVVVESRQCDQLTQLVALLCDSNISTFISSMRLIALFDTPLKQFLSFCVESVCKSRKFWMKCPIQESILEKPRDTCRREKKGWIEMTAVGRNVSSELMKCIGSDRQKLGRSRAIILTEPRRSTGAKETGGRSSRATAPWRSFVHKFALL